MTSSIRPLSVREMVFSIAERYGTFAPPVIVFFSKCNIGRSGLLTVIAALHFALHVDCDDVDLPAWTFSMISSNFPPEVRLLTRYPPLSVLLKSLLVLNRNRCSFSSLKWGLAAGGKSMSSYIPSLSSSFQVDGFFMELASSLHGLMTPSMTDECWLETLLILAEVNKKF